MGKADGQRSSNQKKYSSHLSTIKKGLVKLVGANIRHILVNFANRKKK
ncbi:MAG: hypothetical protein J5382_05600 [Bacteroidales bacterium]|nr:hypothetical protein [Bacteroidales bacterium]